MATAAVLTVAQTLFAALQCKELKELCSMFSCKSDLEDLQRTASTIKSVFLDADSKLHVLSHEAGDWIDKLKDVVYDVDDLLDEFNTVVQRHKLQEQNDGGKAAKKIARKVRRFFSTSNKFIVAFNTSLNIKNIRKKLDAIASDHSKFGFSVDYEPIRRVRKETLSCVNKDRIFGREGDKEVVVSLLLQDHNASTIDHNVSFVAVVGMGGLGKTTLAQLVYDDDRIKNGFDLRLWICVSDEFGVREILVKMLKSVSDKNWDHLDINQLRRKVEEQLENKNFLLVLDDVWCEKHKDWVDLKDIFIHCNKGGRILVTTRSNLVARAAGCDAVHRLKGLSPEDSWDLFAYMAYDNGGHQSDARLVEIGREILQKCANVPLSIKVTASMLYRQELSKWQTFNEIELSKIRCGEDDTMAILKLSYDYLTPSLKSCFGYCALFPKDYRIEKEMLINIWLAQGCLEPQFEGQRIQVIGEQYFSILLNRCFFQEIQIDIYGDVWRCKMHDLVHDLAQEVAGREILSWSGDHFNRNLRHLSLSSTFPDDLFNQNEVVSQVKMIRTLLALPPVKSYLFNTTTISLIVSKCKYLRVLNLTLLKLKVLPSTVGELVHLRYLDLFYNNELEMLPESITKLHNLQVLILAECWSLKALPKDLTKLENLNT